MSDIYKEQRSFSGYMLIVFVWRPKKLHGSSSGEGLSDMHGWYGLELNNEADYQSSSAQSNH